MDKKEVERFFGNAFFNALNPMNHSMQFVENVLKNAWNLDNNDVNGYVYDEIIREYLKMHGLVRNDLYNGYCIVAKHTVLIAFKENELLEFICEDDEAKRITSNIERKQFETNLIKKVETRITFILNNCHIDYKELFKFIHGELKKQIDEFNSNYILKSLGNLKKRVYEASSGISNQCFLELDKFEAHISKELDTYIQETHKYYLTNEHDYSDYHSDSYYLSRALVDDEEVWKNGRNIKKLLAAVEKYSDIKHAQKIIDFAFSELCKDEKMKFLYEHHLPFAFYTVENNFADNAKRSFEKMFSKIANIDLSLEETKGFLYPLFKGYDEQIAAGKKVFESFIKTAYMTDSAKVLDILSNPSNKIQDYEELEDGRSRRDLLFSEYIDYETIGYYLEEAKIIYLSSYYDNFMINESIIGRFYYRIYLINKYFNKHCSSVIYEDIFNLLSMIDKKYGTKCLFGMDTELREKNYNGLKSVLSKHGLNISDKYKAMYIIALLDRKYASIDERSMFAELEQFGDAIYDLAADNILFYNSDWSYILDTATHTSLVQAEAQIKVAKKIGTDKLYVSRLHSSFNQKYDRFDYDDESNNIDKLCEQKYIADSLEMIVGVIAKEFGVQKALDFATQIILEANPDYHKPDFVEHDFNALINSEYDDQYINKIYPGSLPTDSVDTYEYDQLWRGLGKVIKIAILGNDTKEKRRVISSTSFDSIVIGGSRRLKNLCIFNYLMNGVEDTIIKFKDIVEKNYIQNKE